MERPAKRPRLGRPPRQRLPRDESEIEDEDGGITRTRADADTDSNADDEDEITMDPEAFAVKQDPQYRLQVSRAKADNKLKSAFERLFDKYGRDFGDTGDEINFYTDEIEVDNGHIASLPLATDEPLSHAAANATTRPRRRDDDDDVNDDGDDEDDNDDDDEKGQGAAVLRNDRSLQPRSRPELSTWSGSGATARLASLLTPRSGPGRSWSAGGSDALLGQNGFRPPPFPGYGSDPVDPAWAVPELFRTPQQDAMALQRQQQQQQQQEQLAGSLSAPARPLVVRKVLPAAFLRPVKEPRRADASDADDAGENDEDDLTLETTTPGAGMGAGTGDSVPRRRIMSFGPSAKRRIQSRSPRRRDSEGSETEGGDKAPVIPVKRPRGRPRKVRPVEEDKASLSPEPTHKDNRRGTHPGPAKTSNKAAPVTAPATEGLAPRAECLPTPPVDDDADDDADGPLKAALDEADRGKSSSRSTTLVVELPAVKVYTRNRLDPSYAFSDEEDGGLRQWSRPPQPTGVAADDQLDHRSTENTEPGPERATAGSEPGSHPPDVAPKRRRRRRRKSEMEAAAMAAAAAAAAAAAETPDHAPAAKRVRRRRSQLQADKDDDGEPASAPPHVPSPMREVPAVRSPKKSAAPVTPQKRPQKKTHGSLLASALQSSPAARWREVPDSQGHSSIISLVSDDSDEENQEPGGPLSHPSPAHRRLQHAYGSAAAASPLAGRQTKRPPTMAGAPLLSASPGSSLLVETPGGTTRRCGQDGFRCGREFCFGCS